MNFRQMLLETFDEEINLWMKSGFDYICVPETGSKRVAK